MARRSKESITREKELRARTLSLLDTTKRSVKAIFHEQGDVFLASEEVWITDAPGSQRFVLGIFFGENLNGSRGFDTNLSIAAPTTPTDKENDLARGIQLVETAVHRADDLKALLHGFRDADRAIFREIRKLAKA